MTVVTDGNEGRLSVPEPCPMRRETGVNTGICRRPEQSQHYVDALLKCPQQTEINAIPKLTVRVRFPSPAPHTKALVRTDTPARASALLGLLKHCAGH